MSLYGFKPTVEALGRLETEMYLKPDDYFDDAELTQKLLRAVEEDGSDVDVEINFGDSLINWLEGCTPVNPLPLHYRCPVCKRSIFFTGGDSWDLASGALKPEYGFGSEFARQITRCTRSGRYARNRMEPETEQVLHSLGISEHWISQMKHTRYLPSKSDIITRLLDELKLARYERNE